ncbi:MAG: hypothetical protein FWC91_01335 [Defluviitaleaceae bacterium]|nr:hypothetical protein [Defluviitaleaceae bacterium]
MKRTNKKRADNHDNKLPQSPTRTNLALNKHINNNIQKPFAVEKNRLLIYNNYAAASSNLVPVGDF